MRVVFNHDELTELFLLSSRAHIFAKLPSSSTSRQEARQSEQVQPEKNWQNKSIDRSIDQLVS